MLTRLDASGPLADRLVYLSTAKRSQLSADDRLSSLLALQDACAAYDPADHQATLRVIYSENNTFGCVSDTARLRESRTD